MPFKLPNYSDLNPTQKAVLNALGARNKMAVIGGPGTGKTIIGIEAAIKMSKSNKRCLFITFSKMLNSFIYSIIKDEEHENSSVEVFTYNKFIYDQIKKLTGYSGIQIETELQTKKFHWNREKVQNILALNIDLNHKMFDYIFIDEAQDLDDDALYYLSFFSDRILVTYDDSQKIIKKDKNCVNEYNHSNILSTLHIGDNFFDLIENYRNTLETERCGKIFLDSYEANDVTLPKVTAKRHGLKPNLINVNFQSYKTFIDHIVEDYDKSKVIAIIFGKPEHADGTAEFYELCNYLKSQCDLNHINFKYKYGDDNRWDFNENGIYLITEVVSKGLEFDEVYIYGRYMNIDNFINRNILYVCFTRSKDLTNILIDYQDKNNSLNKLLLDYKFMFNEIEWRGESVDEDELYNLF